VFNDVLITDVTDCESSNGVVEVVFPPSGGADPSGSWEIAFSAGEDAPSNFVPFTNNFVQGGLTFGNYSIASRDSTGVCTSDTTVFVAPPAQVLFDTTTFIPSCDDFDQVTRAIGIDITNFLDIAGNYRLVITDALDGGTVVAEDNDFMGPDTIINLQPSVYNVAIDPLDPGFCPNERMGIDLRGGGPTQISFDAEPIDAICVGGYGTLILDNIIFGQQPADAGTLEVEIRPGSGFTTVLDLNALDSLVIRDTLRSGNYQVVIRQQQDVCSDPIASEPVTFIIDQPNNNDGLITFEAAANDAPCLEGSGTIVITNIAAQEGPFQVEIEDFRSGERTVFGGFFFPTNQVIIDGDDLNLVAGEYGIRIIQNLNGCPGEILSAQSSVFISQPTETTLNFDFEASDALCFGETGFLTLSNLTVEEERNFDIELYADGDLENVIFTKTATVANATINGNDFADFVAGSYFVRVVQNQSDCTVPVISAFEGFVIGQPTEPLTGELFVRDSADLISLPERGSGRIIVRDIDGGTLPYFTDLFLENDPVFDAPDTVPFDENTFQYQIEYNELITGNYTIRLTDINDCEVILPFSIGRDTLVFVPNVFTPNGDGFNDVFFIRNLPSEGTQVVITNRWGRPVFEDDDYRCVDANECDWDGGGLPDGIYFYRIQLPEGGELLSGWVEILSSGEDN
jgi:gliding motility-associated-like protein